MNKFNFMKKKSANQEADISEKNQKASYDAIAKMKKKHIDVRTSMLSTINIWQFVALLSLFGMIGSLAGWYNLASKPKFIPYVVQMDKLKYVYPMMPAAQTVREDPRIKKHYISTFIHSTRTITPDLQLQRKMIFDSYALVNQNAPAFHKLNMQFNPENGQNPFEKSKEFLANVEIESIIPLVGDSWQVEWNEVILQRTGEELAKYRMRATITLKNADLDTGNLTEEEMRVNPLGIFVEDFSWQKLN